MIFSDPATTKQFKVDIKSMKITSKGGLRMKARDATHPNEEAGYMTFSSKEVAKMRKLFDENET